MKCTFWEIIFYTIIDSNYLDTVVLIFMKKVTFIIVLIEIKRCNV